MINPQTTLICSMLELVDPNAVFLGKDSTYKLPDGENVVESDEEEDDVDEDYESEASFISLSGSERSFSDRSFSLLSQNDSITSADNLDDISEANNSDSVNKEAVAYKSNDSLNMREMAGTLSTGKQSQVVSNMKLTPRRNASTEELSDLVAAQQKEKLKMNLSLSSLSSASSDDKEKAKLSSLSDSSLECKYLDISDDDPELQEMLVAQRSQSTNTVDDKKPADVIEISWEDEDSEFQEIVSMQKKTQETIPDPQKDFDLKPVYQSSPAVSMDDRIEQNMSSDDLSPESRLKRDRLKMRTFESPMMKKFKRRNSELYFESSKDEDDIDS